MRGYRSAEKGRDRRSVGRCVIRSGAEKFVYVSCNPKTLQRDVRYVGDTFEVASVTPYNMFPKTAELETLCVMKRKSL